MSGVDDFTDPRLILLIIYGVFVLTLAIFSGSHFLCGSWCPRRFRGQAARGEVAESESEGVSDGIIYYLLSAERKKEIDGLRHNIFCRLLRNHCLTLQQDNMLKEEPESMDENDTSDEVWTDIEEGDIEEGVDKEVNERLDGDNPSEARDKLFEEYTHIAIPLPGVGINDSNPNDGTETRKVPIFCAVCLSEYEISDEICWSSNSNCTHVFHRECIVQWLVALGKRKSSMRRFPETLNEKRLLKYQLECPCCRQDFISNLRKEKV